jgi:hypothetical protein
MSDRNLDRDGRRHDHAAARLDPRPSPGQGLAREELAILKTVVYGDLFHYPLRLEELRDGLFDVALTSDELGSLLGRSPRLAAVLDQRDGFVFLRGRDEILAERPAAEKRTRVVLASHERALALLGRLPYVRLLALSGAAAFDNLHDDDVDLFIIAARRRAWSVCLLVTLLSRLLGVRRTVCANYILDEEAIVIAERDFYTAHQLTHLRPLVGGETHRAFVEANPWARSLFPAAFDAATARMARPARVGLVERLLALGPGALLEAISRRVLSSNLQRKIPRGPDTGAVRLERGRLKLHTNDHRPPTLRRFERALTATVTAAERASHTVAPPPPHITLGAIS